MPKPTTQDVKRLLEAAAKLIADYHSEFHGTRYTIDDKNMDRLIDAMEPFAEPTPPPFDCARGWGVRS